MASRSRRCGDASSRRASSPAREPIACSLCSATAAVRLAIVSNGRSDMQSAKLAALGLDVQVDTVVISESIGVKKPDPRIYEHALRLIGTSAAESIYVGDHPALDVVGPMAVGLRAAWLRLDRQWPVELPPPTWTIGTLDEVLCLPSR